MMEIFMFVRIAHLKRTQMSKNRKHRVIRVQVVEVQRVVLSPVQHVLLDKCKLVTPPPIQIIFLVGNVWQGFGRVLKIPIVQSARLVCTKTTTAKQVAKHVTKVFTTMQLNQQQSMPAKNVHVVRTRQRWVLQK